MNNPVYILDAKRTAVGKYGGALSGKSIIEVTSVVIKDIYSKNPHLKFAIQEVILGNVLSAGLGQNPARQVSIKSGLSNKIPAFTINKVCGSGLKSVILGVQAIQNEDADVILAGGMESMSRTPYYVDNYRFGVKSGNQTIRDGMIYDALFCSLIGEHMGVTAENVAMKYKISRERQDIYAYESHMKSISAIDGKKFKEEIVPIEIKNKKGESIFNEDEQPRRDTTLEKLKSLRPAFKEKGTVTAGNSSSINDGAAIVLLGSEKTTKKNKIKPMAVIREYASFGLDPAFMGLGSYYAAESGLKKSGIKKSDIDLWEINEAFASQSIAVIDLLAIDPKIVNVNGGAIALGHPVGASGSRIVTTLLYELKRRKARYGVASLCIGGGQGIAMVIENL